jgi:hypothetical protein
VGSTLYMRGEVVLGFGSVGVSSYPLGPRCIIKIRIKNLMQYRTQDNLEFRKLLFIDISNDLPISLI